MKTKYYFITSTLRTLSRRLALAIKMNYRVSTNICILQRRETPVTSRPQNIVNLLDRSIPHLTKLETNSLHIKSENSLNQKKENTTGVIFYLRM